MTIFRTFFAALGGAAVGVATIISCGGGSTVDVADAAAPVCDCPAAEPPLEGRIVRVEDTRPGSENINFPGAAAVCPVGSMVLGGGCEAKGVNNNALVLFQSGQRDPSAPVYACEWLNPDNRPGIDSVTAWATCLIPAPAQ